MRTELLERLGLTVPLIQAPMAGVSTPEMAAAVSNAGALGSVALGALNAAQARQVLASTRSLTDRPIAANVFTHPAPRRDPAGEAAFLQALAPLFEAADSAPPARLSEIYRSFNDDEPMLDVISDARPEVVSLHFGPATAERMSVLKAVGCFVMATATTVAEATLLEASGVDAIVLQGFDAGGHSGAFLGPPDPETAGQDGLLARIREVVGCVRIPVIAAGGLMDGRDVARVLDAGASAAQLGTAFVGCNESLANPTYRSWLTSGAGTHLTSRLSGRPARALVNPLYEALEGLSLVPPDYPLAYDAVKQLAAATGDPRFGVMWAGAGAARAQTGAAVERVAAIREALPSPFSSR